MLLVTKEEGSTPMTVVGTDLRCHNTGALMGEHESRSHGKRTHPCIIFWKNGTVVLAKSDCVVRIKVT